jgi:hypothetical protein
MPGHNGSLAQGYPTNQLRASLKRIIIWPRLTDVNNSQGLIGAISQYLTDNAGWFVAPPELALEIASRAEDPTAPPEAIDADSDMPRFLSPEASVLNAIAVETRSDAVLEVRLVKVTASVRGYIASWDGMTESIASRKSHSFTPFGGSGWVYAATAEMYLWSRAGFLLWKQRRGFAVLGVKSGISSKLRERPLSEVYRDSDAMQGWLEATLGTLAPPIKRPAANPP